MLMPVSLPTQVASAIAEGVNNAQSVLFAMQGAAYTIMNHEEAADLAATGNCKLVGWATMRALARHPSTTWTIPDNSREGQERLEKIVSDAESHVSTRVTLKSTAPKQIVEMTSDNRVGLMQIQRRREYRQNRTW